MNNMRFFPFSPITYVTFYKAIWQTIKFYFSLRIAWKCFLSSSFRLSYRSSNSFSWIRAHRIVRSIPSIQLQNVLARFSVATNFFLSWPKAFSVQWASSSHTMDTRSQSLYSKIELSKTLHLRSKLASLCGIPQNVLTTQRLLLSVNRQFVVNRSWPDDYGTRPMTLRNLGIIENYSRYVLRRKYSLYINIMSPIICNNEFLLLAHYEKLHHGLPLLLSRPGIFSRTVSISRKYLLDQPA